jgi:hypothetical protein
VLQFQRRPLAISLPVASIKRGENVGESKDYKKNRMFRSKCTDCHWDERVSTCHAQKQILLRYGLLKLFFAISM